MSVNLEDCKRSHSYLHAVEIQTERGRGYTKSTHHYFLFIQICFYGLSFQFWLFKFRWILIGCQRFNLSSTEKKIFWKWLQRYGSSELIIIMVLTSLRPVHTKNNNYKDNYIRVHTKAKDSSRKNTNSVINYTPLCIFKPVRPSFILGTQMKLFLMKSKGPFLPSIDSNATETSVVFKFRSDLKDIVATCLNPNSCGHICYN